MPAEPASMNDARAFHEAIMDHSAKHSPDAVSPQAVSAIVTAAGATMDMASSMTMASMEAAGDAADAAGNFGSAVAELDLPSSAASFADMTLNLWKASATGVAGATLTTGSVTMTALGIGAHAVSQTAGLAAAAATNTPTNTLQDEECKVSSPDLAVAKADVAASHCRDTVTSRVLETKPAAESTCFSCLSGIRAWSPFGTKAVTGANFGELRQVSEEAESEDVLLRRNQDILQRHTLDSDWQPTVLLYDAATDPPPKRSTDRPLRRAYRLPLNPSRPSRIENDYFDGHFVFLHRSESTDSAVKCKNPYQYHFDNKSRRWEARVQGRFKKKPKGTLYTGCVLEDFDYADEPSWAASVFTGLTVPLMEMAMGERFYFAWGSRGEDARKPDSEFSTIVTNFAGFDQVIVTPSHEAAPSIDSDITGLGFCRNAMSSHDYRRAVKDATDQINAENTYTFCVWGCSKYIDVMNSCIKVPGVGSVDYSGFLGEWPAHFLMYSLDDDGDERCSHTEDRKKYYVDVMVWSSDMKLDQIPRRYEFHDER